MTILGCHPRKCSNVAVIVLIANSALQTGCWSVGKDQLTISHQPFAFVDAKSGATLDRVLIVPKYLTSTGVSSGAGHGPGYMSNASFLAFPFVYGAGEAFAPAQPDSKGLVIGRPGDFFVGRGVSIRGVIVIVPGYRSEWVWPLWERAPNTKVLLQPLPAVEADEHLRRLQGLLGGSRIRGAELSDSEREMFSTIKDFDIDVHFNPSEQQLIRGFLIKAK